MAWVPEPSNEPVLDYAPGAPERAALAAELERQRAETHALPLVIGGERISTAELRRFSAPHDHELVLGEHPVAGEREVGRAIDAARAVWRSWSATPLASRAAVLLRAAELLAGPWRQRLNAATMLGQSKTSHQAEIDAACELIDFFRFNAYFASELASERLVSPVGAWNQLELRPLDGFVYAVTPFNFTSIAGNLPTAPALMGNTVVWKPSPHAMLSAFCIMELLEEAGLPPGVINLVQGDAAAITRQVLAHPDFAGLHFTGSTAVLRGLYAQIGENVARYRGYPRIVGESGGKDFIVAHPSAGLDALAVAILRGGFEYQGQKCSAASRLYLPRSLWPKLRERLRELIGEIEVGDPADFGVFMGAVISREAFDRSERYQKLAREDPGCSVVTGGGADAERGYFVEPTLVECQDPRHRLMTEEIFGPIVSAFVYDDARFEETLALVDENPYGLTGAVFARDRGAITLASERLRHAAGNFYINDKPTGAVVGQQPFGGARASGTNDKAGSAWNLMRWASPRVVKETFVPPREWRYPYQGA